MMMKIRGFFVLLIAFALMAPVLGQTTVEGEVTAINLSRREMTVRKDNGDSVVVHVDRVTKMDTRRGEVQGSDVLERVRIGSDVKVTGKFENNVLLADEIERERRGRGNRWNRGNQTDFFPDQNAQVSELRPAIGMKFAKTPQPGRTQLLVDGRDFTQQANIANDEIRWQPGYDLAAGWHTVKVTTSDAYGHPDSWEWKFNINPNAATTPQPGQANATVYPSHNTSITDRRPTVRAVFPYNIQPYSAKMTIDGVDFSQQLKSTFREVSWTAPYDLDYGLHRVAITVFDNQSRAQTQNWDFNITNTGQQPIQPQPQNVLQPATVFSPQANGVVTPRFQVTGRTEPNAPVEIIVSYNKAILKGIIGEKRQFNVNGMSDASGFFNLQVDVTSLPSGTDLLLSTTANVSGQTTPVSELRVRRQ